MIRKHTPIWAEAGWMLPGPNPLDMKKMSLLILLAALPAAADDWKDKLSPRMREAFQEMARDDWKPQKAATLSEREKEELRILWEQLRKVPVMRPAPPVPAVPPPTEGK